MASKVTQTIHVQSFETDCFSRLKPFFLQGHVQEVAYMGSAACGVSYEQMRSQGLFWALNRIHLHVDEWPVWGDDITLETWPQAQVGPLWMRNFKIYRNGSTIVLGTSAWTLLSLKERTIIRSPEGFDPSQNIDESTLPFCSKIIVPKTLEAKSLGTRTAVWSDMDTNGHVNNCMYTRWAMDTLPAELLQKSLLKDLQVCYYHEVHVGDVVEFICVQDGNRWYISGINAGTTCFTVLLEFTQ